MCIPNKVRTRTLNGFAVECSSDFVDDLGYTIIPFASFN